MTLAELKLLEFLCMDLSGHLDEWAYQPTRAERRQRLQELIRAREQEQSEFSRVKFRGWPVLLDTESEHGALFLVTPDGTRYRINGTLEPALSPSPEQGK